MTSISMPEELASELAAALLAGDRRGVTKAFCIASDVYDTTRARSAPWVFWLRLQAAYLQIIVPDHAKKLAQHDVLVLEIEFQFAERIRSSTGARKFIPRPEVALAELRRE